MSVGDSDGSYGMSKAMKVVVPPESLQLWGVSETIYDCVDTVARQNKLGYCKLRTEYDMRAECNVQGVGWRTTIGGLASDEQAGCRRAKGEGTDWRRTKGLVGEGWAGWGRQKVSDGAGKVTTRRAWV